MEARMTKKSRGGARPNTGNVVAWSERWAERFPDGVDARLNGPVVALLQDVFGLERLPSSQAIVDLDAAVSCVLAALATLPLRQRLVLVAGYGFGDGRPRTTRELGEVFGASLATIHRARTDGLAALRGGPARIVMAAQLGLSDILDRERQKDGQACR
jgi:DNA-directed RNA polymerase specialized sigma24 family protein